MKVIKELGLVLLGMLIAYTVIWNNSLHIRLRTVEANVESIVRFLRQPPQAVPQEKK